MCLIYDNCADKPAQGAESNGGITAMHSAGKMKLASLGKNCGYLQKDMHQPHLTTKIHFLNIYNDGYQYLKGFFVGRAFVLFK